MGTLKIGPTLNLTFHWFKFILTLMLLREWILKLDKFKQEGLYSLFNGSNLHPRLNWLVKTRCMKLETLTVFLEKRRNNTTNLSWGSNIETVQDELCSNMKVFQDSLCLILDLEGFFINKTFHARELGYFTWNQEHGRHAFFVSVLYKTLCDKDKRKVNFVISKIHGFAYQPSQTEHAQNPRIAGTLITFSFPEPSFPLTSDWKTIPAAGQKDRELWGRECLDQGLVPRLQYCRENRGGPQKRSRGERCLDTTEYSFAQSRNSRVSQILCIEISNSPSSLVTQLRFSCRWQHASLSSHRMYRVLAFVQKWKLKFVVVMSSNWYKQNNESNTPFRPTKHV